MILISQRNSLEVLQWKSNASSNNSMLNSESLTHECQKTLLEIQESAITKQKQNPESSQVPLATLHLHYQACLRQRLSIQSHHCSDFCCSLTDLKQWCWDVSRGLRQLGQEGEDALWILLRHKHPQGTGGAPLGWDFQCREGPGTTGSKIQSLGIS